MVGLIVTAASDCVTEGTGEGKDYQGKAFCNRTDLLCVDIVTLFWVAPWLPCSGQCPEMNADQMPVSLPSSQVFRTDLITAMKLHDSYQLNPDDYYVLADPWRQEWEKGVQVPVSPGTIPQPVAR